MRQPFSGPVFVVFLFTCSSTVHAGSVEDEAELALSYGDKSMVSIATGSRQPLRRAPSVATVITAEDIKAIGATDLDEVLESVPGLHVARSPLGYEPIFVFRGIYSVFNSQILMLQNGIPTTLVFTNGKSAGWGGLPLENIARIEIIRGPASALYGADAYAGVINIITKTAADAPGTELGLRGGSFNSRDGWMHYGGELGSVEAALYLRAGTTDGFKKTIEADRQSLIDPSVSLAPGEVNTGRDAIDGSLDLGYERWRLRFGYKERRVETGAGIASALDPSGGMETKRVTADLTWTEPQLTRDWGAGFTAGYLYFRDLAKPDFVLFPPGADLGFGSFADGMIASPNKWERQYRLGAFLTYTGFADHSLRVGVGHDDLNMYKTTTLQNFTGIATPVGAGSAADVTDFTETAPFMSPKRRKLDYFYLQDEWHFARDWTLTAGVRRDDYSDFGGVTSPRVALVWDVDHDLTAKLLYGSAFRAPAFIELYPINNPVALGNPDLKPETIKTLETVLSWEARKDTRINVTLFRYEMKDIIRLIDTMFQNTSGQSGRGVELEAVWDASRTVSVSGNYAYQRSISEATGQDAGFAPRQHLYLRSDVRLTSDWLLSGQVNHVADRRRPAGDSRPKVADYTTVDFALSTARRNTLWAFTAAVRNLFDADAREPDPAVPMQIPNDLPLAGRWYYLQVSYEL